MISHTTKHEQQELREKYYKEHDELVKEYGINPTVTGAYALVIPVKAEDKSSGGIILNIDDGDHMAMRIGMVVAFGPTALVGYELPEGKVTRCSQDYGISPGDFVEYPIHCGRRCGYKQFKNYRVLPASDLSTVYKEVS